MTTVIIICAGESTRWANYLGMPKHLVPTDDGERLLDRTVRLAREHGAEQVYVVARPGQRQYATPGAALKYARLDPGNYDADKFLSSRHLWSDTSRTVVLYGDVYFSDEAMATIMAPRADWTLYCRPGASKLTGARAGECFAIGFHPTHHSEFAAALTRVADLRRRGIIRRCGGWETYRAMNRVGDSQLRTHRMHRRHVIVDDWTEDFDKPADYDQWLGRRNRTVSVIVPWRPDASHRDAAWAWCRTQWETQHPGWQLIEAHDPTPDGPWCKAAAIAAGLQKASGALIVVADADVWCEPTTRGDAVAAAVATVFAGQPWAVPHRLVHRLTESATTAVLAGAPLARAHDLVRPAYRGRAGGGITVVPRNIIDAAPPDPRFRGWGQEDDAWALALGAVAGAPWRGRADLYHLWHDPQPRATEIYGSAENKALYQRYQRAARSRRAMKQLLAEIPPGPRRGSW